MTDLTSNPPPRMSVSRRRRTAEFRLYFTLIFVAAIPFGTVSWLRDIFRLQTLNIRGPLARAWAEADRMTPLIFSA